MNWIVTWSRRLKSLRTVYINSAYDADLVSDMDSTDTYEGLSDFWERRMDWTWECVKTDEHAGDLARIDDEFC